MHLLSLPRGGTYPAEADVLELLPELSATWTFSLSQTTPFAAAFHIPYHIRHTITPIIHISKGIIMSATNSTGNPLGAPSLSTLMAASLPKAAGSKLNSAYEAVALAAHAGMIAVGFRLTGLGEDDRIGQFTNHRCFAGA